MSLQGKVYTVKVHTNSTNRLVLDSLEIKDFTYESGAATVKTVYVEDYPAGHLDTYRVQFAYIVADIPASSTSLATLLSNAQTEIAAVVPGGVGGGTPSIDPSV